MVGEKTTPDNRPVPDPTILTTQQLLRELASLKELVESGSNLVSEKVSHLQELHAEKFKSIAIQFQERDTRTEQTSRDSKVAVDAALQAAKEAVGEQNKSNALAIAKSEGTFTKQIDQLGALINTQVTGLNDKIDDLKNRLTLTEGNKKGSEGSWGIMMGIGGLVCLVISAVVAVVVLAKHP